MKPTDLPPKLAVRLRIDPETGCWLWTGALTVDGYGQVPWPPGSRKMHRAHRLVWTLLSGSIPDGMVLDHLCRVRHCVNPDHMEVVTQSENARRLGGAPNTNGRCRNGRHAWIPANIYVHPLRGNQACRRCMEEQYGRHVAAGLRRKARPGPGQGSLL